MLRTTWALASRFRSMTSRVPARELSLRASRMPSMRRSRTSSSIFDPIDSTDVWYGTSVTMMRWPPRASSSISATARIRIEPRPVR